MCIPTLQEMFIFDGIVYIFMLMNFCIQVFPLWCVHSDSTGDVYLWRNCIYFYAHVFSAFRYFHSGVCIPTLQEMFIFGGIVGTKGATNEMWRFALGSQTWRKVMVCGTENVVVFLQWYPDCGYLSFLILFDWACL